MAFDHILVAGTTSQVIEVTFRDPEDGSIYGGLGYNEVTVQYFREGAADAVEPEVIDGTIGTWSSGGWSGDDDIYGLYQYGIPDAALSAGAKAVTFIFTATGTVPIKVRILLVALDIYSAKVAATIAAGDIAENAIDANAIKADAITEIADGNIQHILRAKLGVSGTVYIVSTAGDDSDGLTFATAYNAPKAAIEGMSAGDGCIIGPGTFSAGASNITQPANTKVIGSGIDTTVITSTLASAPIWVPGDNSYCCDLTVSGPTDASIASGTKESSGDAAFTGAVLERVKLNGQFDSLFIGHTGVVSATLVDCQFRSAFDCVACNQGGAGSVIDLIRPVCFAESTTLPVSGVKIGASGGFLTRVVDATIYVKSTAGGSSAVAIGAEAGRMVVTGGALFADGVAVSYDLYQSGAAIVDVSGTQYDRTKTSGTITEAATDLDTQLHMTQPNYLPAKAGDEMDLIDAPNATAVTAIQDGLATPTNITAGTITTVTTVTNAVVTDAASRTASKADVSGLATSVELAAVETHGDATWTTATSTTVSDKTGFKLASDGLDSVATAAPTGLASNFREMLVQVWGRWFGKVALDKDAGTIKTYADNGTDVLTTQTIADDGTTQTQGKAS